MKTTELLALGLKKGRRYKVRFEQTTSKSWSVTHDLYFAGYILKNRQEPADSLKDILDDIIPIFNLPTKKGKMSDIRYDAKDTSPGNILSIELFEKPTALSFYDYDDESPVLQRLVDANEASEAADLVYTLEQQAVTEFQELVFEMGWLFPGKRILLNPDGGDELYASYEDNKGKEHIYATIVSVGTRGDGTITYELDTKDGLVEMNSEDNYVTPETYTLLLSETLTAIECADFIMDELNQNTFINTDDPYTAIPETDPKRHPVLSATGCLDHLKWRLWFDSLTVAEKQAVLGDLADEDDTEFELGDTWIHLDKTHQEAIFRAHAKKDKNRIEKS